MPRISTMNSARASEPSPSTCVSSHEEDQGDEGGEHEHVAVGEVDHADDAEHHRVADGDQAVDGAQRDAVDELLEEIFHALAPPSSRPRVARCRLADAARGGYNADEEARHSPALLPKSCGSAGRPRSEHVVGAVAEGLVVGALAAAQVERARAVGHEAMRLEGWWPCASRRRRAAWPSARRCTRNRASRPPASPGRGPSGRRPARRTSGNLPATRCQTLGSDTRTARSSLAQGVRPRGSDAYATLSFSFSTILPPASSTQVNSNSPGPGTFMKKER